LLLSRSLRFSPGRGTLSVLLASCFLADRPPIAQAAFTDITVSFGIDQGDSMSYGASFIDYDGDGDPDFYANNHFRTGHFFRNDGGTTVELSQHLDVPAGFRDRHDDMWFDLENDGDPDQYIIHGRDQPPELFLNQGWVELVNGTLQAGALSDTTGRGRELSVADFNGDNLLDVFVVNDFRQGFNRPSALFLNDGDGTFTKVSNSDAIYRSRLHIAAADYDLDGFVDVVTTNPPIVDGEFYQGNGDTSWTNATDLVFQGITAPLRQAQGLSWADYDDDGYLDLLTLGGNRGVWDYAGIETDSLRYYFEADPGEQKEIVFTTDGTQITLTATEIEYQPVKCYYGSAGDSTSTYPFTISTTALLGEPPQHAGGRGAYLWVASGGSADTVHFAMGGPGGTLMRFGGALRTDGSFLSFTTIGQEPPPPLADDNWTDRLYHNEGDGTFSEVTSTAFAANDSTFNGMGAAWGDYDNDGYIDVYIANGGTVAVGNQPNYLHRNNGDGTFTEVAAAEGVTGSTRGMSDGACWADVNADGFLDLFVNHGAEVPPFGVGPRELFRNTPNGNHWLRFKLRGLTNNGSGIGARVRVKTGTKVQWRTRLGDNDNCFTSEETLHFGLGAATVADTVQVFWPNGLIDTYESVAADRTLWAIEGKPLRPVGSPHFRANRPDVFDELVLGQVQDYPVPLDNLGGQASYYSATYKSCAGDPINWISVEPDSGTVFPGGTSPATLTVDTSSLAVGLNCGRVIFESNSFLGPDTLSVFIEVTDSSVGAGLVSAFPGKFHLSRPVPNPSREGFTMELALPEERHVDVLVYDIQGRRVASLASGALAAGWHRIGWDRRDASGSRVGAGTYVIRAVSGAERSIRRAVILD
jgi:hypothetical protein